jgi:hypothetical protein
MSKKSKFELLCLVESSDGVAKDKKIFITKHTRLSKIFDAFRLKYDDVTQIISVKRIS